MITIFGAGIAGLTAALELINNGFQVQIFEKDNLPGGMAKSKRINGIPSEHSWRGYASFYYNTFNLLKQIKIQETEHFEVKPQNKSYTIADVALHNKKNDAWIIYKGYVYDITYFVDKHPGGSIINNVLGKDVEKEWEKNNVSWHLKNKYVIEIITKNKIGKLIENFDDDKTAYNNLVRLYGLKSIYNKENKFDPISLIDYPKIIYGYLKFLFGNKRNQDDYNKSLLATYNEKNLHKNTFDNLILKFSGPGLGFDYTNASLGSIHFYFDCYLNDILNNKFINNWYVMNKPTSEGFIDPLVKLLEQKGVKIYYNYELQQINHLDNKIINCRVNNKIIKSDDYIIAINPNNLELIFSKSKMDKLAELHNNLKIINNQISFRLGINKKVSSSQSGFVLIDSPNNITFYLQDNFFNEKYEFETLLSGTCVMVHDTSMTREKFIENIINQILESNVFNLDRSNIVYSEIYDEWVTTNNRLESKNKKWVNTYYNEKYKPEHKTEYSNLYLAGAHTNTSFKIWSMESACESGKIVANLILEKNNKNKIPIHTHTKPLISKLISPIDDLLYDKKLNSVIYFICIFIIILILLKFFH